MGTERVTCSCGWFVWRQCDDCPGRWLDAMTMRDPPIGERGFSYCDACCDTLLPGGRVERSEESDD